MQRWGLQCGELGGSKVKCPLQSPSWALSCNTRSALIYFIICLISPLFHGHSWCLLLGNGRAESTEFCWIADWYLSWIQSVRLHLPSFLCPPSGLDRGSVWTLWLTHRPVATECTSHRHTMYDYVAGTHKLAWKCSVSERLSNAFIKSWNLVFAELWVSCFMSKEIQNLLLCEILWECCFFHLLNHYMLSFITCNLCDLWCTVYWLISCSTWRLPWPETKAIVSSAIVHFVSSVW